MISNQDQYVFWKDTFLQDKFPSTEEIKFSEIKEDMLTNRIFDLVPVTWESVPEDMKKDLLVKLEAEPTMPQCVGEYRGKPMSASKTEADPNGKEQHEPGAKVDAGKNRVWLCVSGFSNALEEVSRITTIGASKYTPNGWVEVPDGQARYMDAFGRHLLALGKGEKYDNGPGGTGGMHKAQMIWNLLASLELELRATK